MRSESEKEILRARKDDIAVFNSDGFKRSGEHFPYHTLKLFVVLQRRFSYIYMCVYVYIFVCLF